MSDNRFTWMHSGQLGAPQMNGASGSNGQMLQVLDGALIDGFNPQTVTIATKTATTVTLTFGVSHGYELSQLILVSGATDAALNGQHRVTAKTATTVTIDAVGVSALTGTIVTKVAHLGWESIFGSTDPLKRAYRSNDTQSSKTVLYLDMTLPAGHGYNATNPAKRAMVSLCEDMTTLGVQINSYTNTENNYATNINGKLFWYQVRGRSKTDSVTDASSRSWVLVGNGSIFYLFNEWRTFGSSAFLVRDFFAFGDLVSFDGVVSTNNCVWIGAINDNDASTTLYTSVGSKIGGNLSSLADIKGYTIKDVDGTGGLKPLVLTVDGTTTTFTSGVYGNAISALATSVKSILGFPVHALTTNGLRASFPALMAIPQNLSGDTASFDRLVADGSVVVSVHDTSGSTSASTIGFYALNLKE